MARAYAEFCERRVKHMELIQAVVTRLGNNSFFVKGWAVTVAGVFFGFAVNSRQEGLAFVSIAPTLFFWGLDSYFLRAERLFRLLYERVRADSETPEPFFMGATSPDFVAGLRNGLEKKTCSIRGTAASATLSCFYGGLIVTAAFVAAVATCL